MQILKPLQLTIITHILIFVNGLVNVFIFVGVLNYYYIIAQNFALNSTTFPIIVTGRVKHSSFV